MSDIIKKEIKEKLDLINSLALKVGTKYDCELKEVDDKIKNLGIIKNGAKKLSIDEMYLKSFYKRILYYIELEIDNLDEMEFTLDCSIEKKITNIIKNLLHKNIISYDNIYDGSLQSPRKGLDIMGSDLIHQLLQGFKLIFILENDTYFKKYANSSQEEQNNRTLEVLKKAKELTSNSITKNMLNEEISQIKMNSIINKFLIVKAIFYTITRAFKTFKKNLLDDEIENITNGILSNIYYDDMKYPKNLKIGINTELIKYNNQSFYIYR